MPLPIFSFDNYSIDIGTTLSIPTYITRDRARKEFIVCPHQTAKLSYSFSKEFMCSEELTNLLTFFNTVKGAGDIFLIKDPLDYQATALPTEYLNSTQQGVLIPSLTEPREYQLAKTYTVGGATHTRNITRPAAVTALYGDGILIPGTEYSVDYDKGRVFFYVAPDHGIEFTANFTFRVPVRFTSDRLKYRLIGRDEDTNNKLYTLETTSLIELKEENSIRRADQFISPNNTFQLDNYFDTITDLGFETVIESLSSGLEARSSRHTTPELRFTTGDRYLSTEEMQYLGSLYRVCHGKAIPFLYPNNSTSEEDLAVRFDSDLFYQLESECDWFTPGLELKQHIVAPTRTITPDTYGNVGSSSGSIVNCTARVVRIVTREGTEYNFTEHDHNITIDGKVYKSNKAFDPTAASSSVNLKIDSLDLKSVVGIDDESINAIALEGGVFDNARVTVAAINWSNPPATLTQAHILLQGTIGVIKQTERDFILEVRTANSSFLNTQKSFRFSPTCQWEFGSSQCGFDLSTVTYAVTIASVNNSVKFSITGTTLPDTRTLDYGSITFTTGKLKGVTSTISFYSGGIITLLIPLPAEPEVGDEATVIQGCDKSYGGNAVRSCRAYGRQNNFGGVPRISPRFLSGQDFLLNPTTILEED